MIGTDVLKNRDTGIGLIEELAQVILDEIESRQGLEDKISAVEKNLIKDELFFSGLSYGIHKHEENPVLETRESNAEGKLIAIEGVLNSVSAIEKYNPALHESYKGSDVNWLLSDFPYFSMRSDNPSYDGNVLGLRMESDVERLVSQSVPFKSNFGWYPYVIVYGFLKNSLSPKFPNIKVIDWSWMQFRLPRSFDDIYPLLNIVLHDQNNSGNAYKPWINDQNNYDLFLYLSSIHLAYGSQSLGYELVRNDIRELATEALSKANDTLPEPLSIFFGK